MEEIRSARRWESYLPQDWKELARTHYENFPVASILLPRRIRPHVRSIYLFARTADDLVDEHADPEALESYRSDFLEAVENPKAAHPLLQRTVETIREFDLPVGLFLDLCAAFARDAVKNRYADLGELLEYCRLSANPVGRLLLHLHREVSPTNLARSDSICTALQILNHCQDAGRDYRERNRIYLPGEWMRSHDVEDADLARERAGPGLREVLRRTAELAAEGLTEGWPLAEGLRGRFGWEIRAILISAGRVLTGIRKAGYDVLAERPELRKTDLALSLAAALVRRTPPPALAPRIPAPAPS